MANGSLIAAGDFNSGLPRSQTDWCTSQIFESRRELLRNPVQIFSQAEATILEF